MGTHLYTVHRKGDRGMRVVGDRFSFLALLLLPIWLIWEGLWIAGLAIIVLLIGAAIVSPVAISPLLYGLAAICAFEGASVIRAELALRGWREAAVVEARTDEGAEELYLTGQPA
jgi:hypothetical protein